jgi:hypothetical protein
MSSDDRNVNRDLFFGGQTGVVSTSGTPGQRIVETRVVEQPGTSYTYTNVDDQRLVSGTPGYSFGQGGTTYTTTGGTTTSGLVQGNQVAYQNVVPGQIPNFNASSVIPGQVVYQTGGNVGTENFFGEYVAPNAKTNVIRTVETKTVQQPTQIVKQVTTVEQPKTMVITQTVTQPKTETIITTTNVEQRKPLIEETYTYQPQAEYNFYDGDVEDLHTEVPQSSGSANCGLIAGIVGLLGALALVGLMAAIVARSGSSCFGSVPLSHLIMAVIAVVVAIICIVALLMARRSVSNHLDVNHLLIAIALIAALIMFAYFLASGVYIYMFRPFHYSDLASQKCGSGKKWNDSFNKNTSFEQGWGLHRRILWWAALLSILLAVFFLIMAICLWNYTKFPIQLTRLVLGAACLAGFILACFGITYLLQARSLFGNSFALKDFNVSYITTLIALLAIGAIILFLNAIWNLFKKRSGHFLFGTVLILFVFVFVCFLGLMLRSFRSLQFSKLQNANDGTCRDLVSNYNQSCFTKICESKYLPAGTGCSKDFMATQWETNNQAAYINPCCCHAFTSSLLCPIYFAGIMCLLFLMAVIIAIAANYYLSDTSEYLEFSDKGFGVYELLFVVGIILCIIAFGLYWGFGHKKALNSQTCPQNKNNPLINRDVYGNIVSFDDPNFKSVNLNKVYGGNVPQSAYLQGAIRNTDPSSPITLTSTAFDLQTQNNIVTLNGNEALCNNANCGWRLGVLVTNGKIVNGFDTTLVGSPESRGMFFNDQNSNSDFVLLKGSQDNLNKALKDLRVNAVDITQPTKVFVNGQQIDLSTLNAQGLAVGESASAVQLLPNGNVFNGGAGFISNDLGVNSACYASNACESNLSCGSPQSNTLAACQTAFTFHSSNGFIDVNIPIQVKDVNGNDVPYNGNTLTSNSYFVHQNTQYNLYNPKIQNGVLSFQVPRPLSGSANVVLNLNDGSNNYLSYSKYFILPADAQNPYQMEPVSLLTKSGKGCVGSADVPACFASQTINFGTVKVRAFDPEEKKSVAGVPIKLMSGLDGTRTLVTSNTDSSGVATFNNVAYDYYTIQFDGSSSYIPSRAVLGVQEANPAVFNLNLRNRHSANTILQQYVNNNNNADQDFNLNIQNQQGYNCDVTPYTKYCGFASHINDVEDNEQGFESIRIHNFTESNYLGYLQNNPASAATCGAYTIDGLTYYKNGSQATSRSLGFDWNSVRKTQANTVTYESLYCFNGWGLNTLRYNRQTGNAKPTAENCGKFWPEGTQWSLSKLRELNSKI